MTRDEHEQEARAVAELVRIEIRHNFQVRRPHYTPPPWEAPGGSAWVRWRDRNLAMHGLEGCRARFPEHFPTPAEEVLAGLAASPYESCAKDCGEAGHCVLAKRHDGACSPCCCYGMAVAGNQHSDDCTQKDDR